MGKINIDSTVMLNNRVRMPLIGFGCAQLSAWTDEQERIIRTAVDAGYRLFDTAYNYESEHGLGRGWKKSGVEREEFFLTTKMPVQAQRMGRKEMIRCFERSLRNLQTDYLDLYLLHWPAEGQLQETWGYLEELYYSGRVRALGMCNVNRRHFIHVMAKCEVMPQVMQGEFNPYCMNEYNRIFCEHNKIQFEAFTPIARGMLKNEPLLQELTEKYDKNIYQLILRWDIQHGISTIPRSSSEKHIRSNVDLYDFEISDEDMERIDALNVEGRSNPDTDNYNG